MGQSTLRIAIGKKKQLDYAACFYSLVKESIAILKSFPTRCQSRRRASASRWNPVLKSGKSSKVCPVMSKAETKPFRKVGNLKLRAWFAFFILQIYQIPRILQARRRLYFLASFAGAAFLGLPLPGTLRIASSAVSGYIASFVKGLMPAVSKRLWTVFYMEFQDCLPFLVL
jgi:hypothetical protein